MKRMVSLFLSVFMMFSFFVFDASAIEEDFTPYVISFDLTDDIDENIFFTEENNTRATGLISSYGLSLSKTGSTLHITGRTYGTSEVIKSGFKDLMVQRRKTIDDPWEDYYEYGNVYRDTFAAALDTKLAVAANYQYRVTCKHYAKKNILSVQTISNVSNIVTTV